MSTLTDTFQPGDVVAYRVRVISKNGVVGVIAIGTIAIPAP